MRRLLTAAGGVLLALCLESAAHAYTYTEVGDAGELLSDAQAILLGTVQGTGPFIDTISGTLTTQSDPNVSGAVIDADLFAISLTAGTTFSAQVDTFDGMPYSPVETSPVLVSLYLFDSQGRGLGYNQGGTNFDFAVTTTGDYYFAIADSNKLPLSDPDDQLSLIFTIGQAGETVPATTDAVLAGWTVGTDTPYDIPYTVGLTNASLSTIPEPSIGGGLLALGSLSLAALGRKKKTSGATK